MIDDSSTPPPPAPSLDDLLRKLQGVSLAEIDLSTTKPGDRLIVITEHTVYTLVIHENRTANLMTNRADRPSGRVVINGCTFGGSSTIKPDHLFCGGNLEFAHGQLRETYTTTKIRALQLVQEV